MLEDQFIDVDGCKIRYWDTGGSGQPVVFIHGIAGCVEHWQHQFESPDQQLRLIALDLPGHGQSGLGHQPYDIAKFTTFIWRFVDAMKLDSISLVGWSMGGAISLRATVAQPDRVKHLVLNSAATLGKESPLIFRLMVLPVLGTILTKPGRQGVEQQIKSSVENVDVFSAELKEKMLTYSSSAGAQQAFVATLRSMTGFTGIHEENVECSSKALKALPIKVLFIHGKQDKVIPYQHSEQASKLVKDSQLELFDNCGHEPQMEYPQRFNQMLLEWLV